jgi:hypothetical protein
VVIPRPTSQKQGRYTACQHASSSKEILVTLAAAAARRTYPDLLLKSSFIRTMSEYGSIPADDADHTFEEYDVNYIQSKALTTKERWTKLLRATVPLVVALVLLGGFGWWTSQAVAPHRSNDKVTTVEYKDSPSSGVMPSSSSSSSSSVIGSTTVRVEPKTNQVEMKPTKSSSSSSSSGSTQTTTKTSGGGSDTSLCSVNSKCSNLGLSGSCCPTNEGVVLGCCD